jgi:two-component system OmpR family response regulator
MKVLTGSKPYLLPRKYWRHNGFVAESERKQGQILVVEDEPEMGRLLAQGLMTDGYQVHLTVNGVDALVAAAEHNLSAAVIDVMLPGMNGFEVCRRLRQSQPSLPILLLTARDAIDDRVKGLDSGADDYLTKPFAFIELHARLRAIRRRESSVPAQSITVGNVHLDHLAHTVAVAGRVTAFSPKEFAVLRMLTLTPDIPVSRKTLLVEVWGSVEHTDANVVDQYVSYLRRKLDAASANVTILTARGVGYFITADG